MTILLFFGASSALNVDFAIFVFFFKSQLCLRFFPAISFALVLGLVTCALRFLLDVLRSRVCFSSLVMYLFILLVRSRTSEFTFNVDDLGEELDQNCVVTQDTPVRCVEKFQRILRRVQINHKHEIITILQVEVRLVLQVGVLIQWQHE